MFHFIIVFAFIQAVICDQVHHRSKREESKCPSCAKDSDCIEKFEMVPGHTACIENGPDAKPITLSAAEKQAIVDHHNRIRAAVQPMAANMLVMYWDDQLEMLANRWASACKKNSYGNMYHDSVRFIPGRTSVGQNLGMGHNNFAVVVDAWANEEPEYRPSFGTQAPLDLLYRVGHYTQIVWAYTNLVGCAVSECSGKKIYACNYAPAGNTYPFNSPYQPTTGTRGDSCPNKRNANGLCDCGNLLCKNDGSLKEDNCTCSCRYEASRVGPTCDVTCKDEDAFYCGKGSFTNCLKTYTTFGCPHYCGYCPCISIDYKSTLCSAGSSSAPGRNVCISLGLFSLSLVGWKVFILLLF